MPSSLSSLVNNLSEINNEKPTDEFIDIIRSLVTSLHVMLIIYLELIKK